MSEKPNLKSNNPTERHLEQQKGVDEVLKLAEEVRKELEQKLSEKKAKESIPENLKPKDPSLEPSPEIKVMNYYEILGVSKDASLEDIKKTLKKFNEGYYRKKVKKTEQEIEEWRRKNEAYNVLSDEEKRDEYDKSLQEKVKEETKEEKPKDPSLEPSPEKDFKFRKESVASEEHPDINEDAMFDDPDKKIAGVFDGIGGCVGGDVAANLARDYVQKPENLERLNRPSPEKTRDELEKIIIEANEEVLRKQPEIDERNAPEDQGKRKGMGTTASIVKIWESEDKKEKKPIVGNVGDGRVYMCRADGKLEQITIDDNLIRRTTSNEDELRAIQSKFSNVDNINEQLKTDEEKELFDSRNVITQNLGDKKGVNPRMHIIEDFKEGDKILIMSDGVSDNLTDKEMENYLREAREKGVDEVKYLIDKAKERSRDKKHSRAKPDDMSLVIIEFPKSESQPQAPEADEPIVVQSEKEKVKEERLIQEVAEQEKLSKILAESFGREQEEQEKLEENYQEKYQKYYQTEAEDERGPKKEEEVKPTKEKWTKKWIRGIDKGVDWTSDKLEKVGKGAWWMTKQGGKIAGLGLAGVKEIFSTGWKTLKLLLEDASNMIRDLTGINMGGFFKEIKERWRYFNKKEEKKE